MTPDDHPGGDGPTKPLPVDPGPTEPIIAPHVPVANLSTAPLDPVGVAGPTGQRDRSRVFMWVLVAAVAILGVVLIVVLTTFVGAQPTPAVTPTPSTTPTVTPPPSLAPTDDGGDETPSEEPPPPAPEPTTPPQPTDPPEPEPTETAAAVQT